MPVDSNLVHAACYSLPSKAPGSKVGSMRILLATLLLIFAAQASAEVYRWVDKNGVVHYTDKPPAPDAKPAELPKLQAMPEGKTIPLGRASSGAEQTPAVPPPKLKIVSPTADQTIRTTTESVTVTVSVNPGLQSNQGLIYFYDGSPVSLEPTRAQSLVMNQVYRGTHTVAVAVMQAGKEVTRSEAVTFYMKPPTVPRPAR